MAVGQSFVTELCALSHESKTTRVVVRWLPPGCLDGTTRACCNGPIASWIRPLLNIIREQKSHFGLGAGKLSPSTLSSAP